MMSQADFRVEEGALFTHRELSMKEDSMIRGAFGQASRPVHLNTKGKFA
jgi:hypothetical protein